jgi:hypothetical protein
MLSIFCVLPNNEDATSFYRGMGPLANIRKTMDFNVIFASKASWSALKLSDMVFMQRPYSSEHLEVMLSAKRNLRPVWIDYDDLLFAVPTSNPAHAQYMADPSVKKRVIQMIQLADVVTVSTQKLKEMFQLPGARLNENIYVVPNALDDDLVPLKRNFQKKRLISWRGSPTHLEDCIEHQKAIVEFSRAHQEWAFGFFGVNPWPITNCLKPERALIVPPATVDAYFEAGAIMNAPVMMVPLTDSVFNRCKSNIAWIEATLFGGVAVAPNWEEWKKPGVIAYDKGFTMRQALESCEASFESGDLAEYNKSSWDYITKHLLLSHVNKQRIEIIEKMLAKEDGYRWVKK